MKKFSKEEAEKLWKKLYEKDSFTAEHCRRVSHLLKDFALKMGFSKEEAEEMEIAALLHDVQKINIPEDIYEKIRNCKPLTDEDRKIIYEHSGKDDILKEYQGVPSVVRDALLYHHEKYDGSGRPLGLKGEEIPLKIRMLSIADYYDVIVVQRPCKIPPKMEPMGTKEAVIMLIDEAGKRFDPNLIPKFLDMVTAH